MLDHKIRPRQPARDSTAFTTTSINNTALTPWLILMSQIVLGVAAYAFTSDLPFFWDDLPQNAWLAQTPFAGIWTATVPGLNYFRPLAFGVWKLMTIAQGGFDPIAMHTLNVVLHIANATFVGLIACRIADKRNTLTGLAAASLFTLFPFSVQAIAPVNSLMHPLHALLVLMAVWLYLRSTTLNATRWASVVLAGAAVLAHENGIVACALITWAALCVERPASLRRVARTVWPYWLACAIGFAIWRAVPRLADPLPLSSMLEHWPDRLQNAALFGQGFAFLFTPLANVLKMAFGSANDALVVASIALAAVAGWLALFRGDRRLWWAAGWFALAALPAVALLGANYVVESPRLLYLASAGAAWFWALPLGLLPRTNNLAVRRALLSIASIVVVASAVWGWSYINKRGVRYGQLGQSVAQLHTATTAFDASDCANSNGAWLAVNYPAWFFVAPAEYALGHDGMTLLAENSTLDALMSGNFGQSGPFEAALLPDILRDGASFRPMGQTMTHDSLQTQARAARGIVVNRSDSTNVRVENAGCRLRDPNAASAPATFDNTLHLLRTSLALDRSNPRRAVLTLDWRASAVPTTDVTVFAQVLDASGQVLAQADGYPLEGTSPMQLWQAGDVWRDRHAINLPASAASGAYRVIVGVYRTGDGQRLAATNPNGGTFDDNAVPVATWTLPK